MKIKIIISIITIFFAVVAITLSLTAYSSTGWTLSSGALMAEGKAYNITDIGVGYTFYCVGSGICYQIIGKNLIINEGLNSINGDWYGVFRN